MFLAQVASPSTQTLWRSAMDKPARKRRQSGGKETAGDRQSAYVDRQVRAGRCRLVAWVAAETIKAIDDAKQAPDESRGAVLDRWGKSLP